MKPCIAHILSWITGTSGWGVLHAQTSLNPAQVATTQARNPGFLREADLEISWQDVSGESGYVIEMSRDGISWNPLLALNANSAFAPIENQAHGRQFRIRAVLAGDTLAASSVVHLAWLGGHGNARERTLVVPALTDRAINDVATSLTESAGLGSDSVEVFDPAGLAGRRESKLQPVLTYRKSSLPGLDPVRSQAK